MKSTTNIQALSKNYGKIGAKSFWKTDGSSTAPQMCLMIQDLTASHQARLGHVSSTGGKAVLVTSQFSHNLPVSLNIKNTAKNLKLTQVEHACSRSELVTCAVAELQSDATWPQASRWERKQWSPTMAMNKDPLERNNLLLIWLKVTGDVENIVPVWQFLQLHPAAKKLTQHPKTLHDSCSRQVIN